MKPFTRHPALLALAAGAAVLLAAFALPLLHMGRGEPAAERNLPWQVAAQPDGGSTVMGLRLGRDTLGDVQARLGDALQPALVARLGETGALEALMEPFAAGFVSGRLVLAFDVPPSTLARWRAAAGSSSPMEGGARRFALSAEHLAQARQMPLAGASFIPGTRLDEADIRERFGPPAQVRPAADGVTLLLYPAQGLAVSVKPGSRPVLQYVAPKDFAERLGRPG